MRRLHSCVDEVGEARAQTVLPCLSFRTRQGRSKEHIADGYSTGWKCSNFLFWVSIPSSALEYVCVCSWELGRRKRSYFCEPLTFFPLPVQAKVRVVFYTLWNMKENNCVSYTLFLAKLHYTFCPFPFWLGVPLAIFSGGHWLLRAVKFYMNQFGKKILVPFWWTIGLQWLKHSGFFSRNHIISI